jgi:hypothetical protein
VRPERRDLTAAAALAAALLALYLPGAATAYGPGDSPLHALAWRTWSVPHPPGYPLNAALGWLWTRAFSPASLCALLHAAAAGTLGFLLARERALGAAGWAAAGLLGLSPLYAYYSGVPEVRALNDLLAAAAALAAARWARGGRPGAWRAFCVLFGLGVSHHPTFVLLAPAFAVWLSARMPPRRELALGAALAAACAGAPYALLGLRLAWSPAPYDLFETKGPAGLLALFLRTGLGGSLQTVAGAADGFDAGVFARQTGWFLDSLRRFAGWPVLVLAAAGAWDARRRDRRELAAWALWLAAPALAYAALSARSPAAFDPVYARAIANRFHLLPMIAVFALAARGLALGMPRAARLSLVALALAAALPGAREALAPKEQTREYMKALLDSSRPGDVVVLAADDAIFAALHLEVAERGGEGRVFLAPSMFAFPPYIRRLRALHPSLVLPASAGALSLDWREWARLNPGRAVLAEAVLAPALGRAPARQGALLRADGRPASPAPVPAWLPTRDWTQEAYLSAARRALAAPAF